MNCSVYLATLLRLSGPQAVRELIARVARRKQGNIRRMALDLNLSRRHLYRYISLSGAYPDVVAARRLSPQGVSDPVARALQEL